MGIVKQQMLMYKTAVNRHYSSKTAKFAISYPIFRKDVAGQSSRPCTLHRRV